ncbi:hypothetical protein ASPZODRAFT_135227 [Penicilliopsis zonata CBS 506.65]|uniref:Alpha/beta hydrolase fold-3 domain-containing protein n=1 Tax=Penicilliopsis zonata CBS 506.65 TaxID=1073090 RepID=A0A1L9SB52_9EURO|nr:hypothetical protein ASPZODRAFT_135227 [Penicilliopsis zonata CBS 506.65]OJJ44403.1 hypothetical protein ASPZODRAFT_135227 [Penicilliopsis zonata CBS 506.65]
MEDLPEPNPVPRLTTSNRFQVLITYLFRIPWVTVTTLARRWSPFSTYKPPPLREHLFRHVMTCIGNNTPPGVGWIIDRNGDKLLSSTRYAHLRSQIYRPVRTPEFAGFWFCRGLSSEVLDPQTADLVLYQIHGGGYVAGHPGASAPEHLFVAEILAQQGISTAIFSLDYTLAPKATLPTSINEAVTAYDWLTGPVNKIDPAKIFVIGESAGGHLVISLLTALHERSSRSSSCTGKETPPSSTKPAAAFLVSPWVNLYTSHPRVLSLYWEERLFKISLDKSCDMVLKGTPSEFESVYGNFAVDNDKRASWKDILPAQTWVSAGSEELVFRYDIEDFVDHAKRDGATISLDIKEGANHTWQCAEASAQHSKLLAMKPGEMDSTLMAGYQAIASAMAGFIGGRNN